VVELIDPGVVLLEVEQPLERRRGRGGVAHTVPRTGPRSPVLLGRRWTSSAAGVRAPAVQTSGIDTRLLISSCPLRRRPLRASTSVGRCSPAARSSGSVGWASARGPAASAPGTGPACSNAAGSGSAGRSPTAGTAPAGRGRTDPAPVAGTG